LRGRIQDANAKLVITADGGFAAARPALKPTVDESVAPA
jgi:acetyl-CoA synthetase